MQRQKSRSLLLAAGAIFVWLTTPQCFSAPQEYAEGCEILIYSNLTTSPTRSRDTHDTCPNGNGPRAFVQAFNPGASAHHGGSAALVKTLKEIAPLPGQQFKCLPNRKCYLTVRGIGVGPADSIAILSSSASTCPPDNSDDALLVHSEKGAKFASSRYSLNEAAIAVFELPDRFTLEDGVHTVCYAPALAVDSRPLDELSAAYFHYSAGTLELSNSLLDCSFEEEATTAVDDGASYAEPVLPCGFRNFRDQFEIDLVWQLGQEETETPNTGPHGDATPGLDGYSLGSSATVVSPAITFPKGIFCVQFKYHMYGTDVSTLRAYTHEVKLISQHPTSSSSSQSQQNLSTAENVLGVWGSPRWVTVGNKGDVWHNGGFEVKTSSSSSSSSSGTERTLQVVFEALAGHSERADIAIDDVAITPGRCSSDIRHHMPKTLSGRITGENGQSMVCGEVRLITGTHSEDKSWHVEGAVSCAGKGYSFDNVNAAWLPCCVPHFGTYSLIVEDGHGDGWTGSKLEFRFFDRVITFGDDDFQREGFHKNYNLIIGSLEVVDIQQAQVTDITISVRVARPKSFAWCGVVRTGSSGKPLRVNFSPATMKQYGVRSTGSSDSANEILLVEIRNVLKENSIYDLYCYSEIIGEEEIAESDTEASENIAKEIASSRIRFSTDRTPPEIAVVNATSTFDSITLDVTTNESSTLWCVAEKIALVKPGAEAGGDGEDDEGPTSISGLLRSSVPEEDKKKLVSAYFKEFGTSTEVSLDSVAPASSKESVVVLGLVANTHYNVFCYAEDNSLPTPNGMSPHNVSSTLTETKTAAKVPSVRLVRRTTLMNGFNLHVLADAPGRVWCVAAATEFGVPSVEEVMKAGAHGDVVDPKSEITLAIQGVQPSKSYTIYCVGGLTAEDGSVIMTSSSHEMITTATTVMSFGKYCDVSDTPETYREVKAKTPFHPITPQEEIKVRDFIMGRQELGLEGVYRITLFHNKTQIYNYYDNKGPKPRRYARVRAGSCLGGDKGLYEQFKVGPIGSGTLGYTRLGRPVETGCGGYNPQGVFGRRRLSEDDGNHKVSSDTAEQFHQFLEESFGYGFGSGVCVLPDNHLAPAPPVESEKRRRLTVKERSCLQLGPLAIEEVCDGPDQCEAERRGRVWIGLRTPEGEKIPFYFIHNVSDAAISESGSETVEHWATRLIHDGYIPDEFNSMLEYTNVWYDGAIFPSLSKMLTSTNIKRYTPESFRATKHHVDKHLFEEARRQRRRLEPHPFPGAAGTAGPLPTRQSRRGGLENRSSPEHVEAQGKRFTVEGSEDQESFSLNYSGWSMSFTNDRDTALKIYNVRFMGQKVAFEMGLMEALAHYSVSERNWFFLDSWYGGLGSAARKVHKGIECPKTGLSVFWDGSLCVFEQDMARPVRAHWKSGEIRDGAPHVALVLRQMLTVSNYDYITDYRFHPTGMFEGTVSFTGELYAGIEVPWYSSRQYDYGVQVTGAMRFAALHAHMAVWKIDLDVGPGDNWQRNSVLISEVIADPLRHGANKIQRTFAENELDAAYFRNSTKSLIYEIVDEQRQIFGNPGGYRVITSPGVNPPHHNFELYSGPAAWAKYRALTTVRKYSELDSTLPRDNKYATRPAVSVDRYVGDNEVIRSVDTVTWISDGIFHLPVVEDMPLTIPIGNQLGWLIKPSNMFYEDPSMDLTNSMGGGLEDPGTCAVVRLDIGEVEPDLKGAWDRTAAPPVRAVA